MVKSVPLSSEEIEAEGLEAFRTAVARSPALSAKVDADALLREVDRMRSEFNNLATLEDLLDFMAAWHARVIATHPSYPLSHWDSAISSNSHVYDGAAAYQHLLERGLGVKRRRVRLEVDAKPAGCNATAVALHHAQNGNPFTRVVRAIYATIKCLDANHLLPSPPPPCRGARSREAAATFSACLDQATDTTIYWLKTADLDVSREEVKTRLVRYWNVKRQKQRQKESGHGDV